MYLRSVAEHVGPGECLGHRTAGCAGDKGEHGSAGRERPETARQPNCALGRPIPFISGHGYAAPDGHTLRRIPALAHRPKELFFILIRPESAL